MFDLGFIELMVIGVVALIVIGPERLPKVARTVGQWLGKLNRYVSQVKQDIDRDMRLDELRKMQQDMKDSAQKYEILANDTARQVEEDVAQETSQISKVMQAMGTTDGGLTTREYEKIKAEEAASGAKPEGEAVGGVQNGEAPTDEAPADGQPVADKADAEPSEGKPKA